MSRLAIPALRLILVGFAGVILLLAVMSFPGMFFFNSAGAHTWIDWAIFIGVESALISVLLIIIALWRLLSLIQRDQLFTPRAVDLLGWVVVFAVVITGIFATALLLLGLFGDDPGPGVVLALFMLLSASLSLITIIVREVVQQAQRSPGSQGELTGG